MPHILAECGALKCEGPEGTGAHANVAPVAFRAARRLFGQFTLIAAVFAHPTDATGTKGGFEGEFTSIEASLDFTP